MPIDDICLWCIMCIYSHYGGFIMFEIVIENGEYWWGGCIFDGIRMPFNKNTNYERKINPNETMNQAAPLLLSNKGRYIWCDSGFNISIKDSKITLTNYLSEPKIYTSQNNMRAAFLEASNTFFAPSGKIPPKIFFLKPIYNTWIELGYNQTQERILEYAEKILKNNLPAGVIMIDDGWSEYYGNWTFNILNFPNPKEMVQKLHKMGFKVILWICPFVSPDSPEFRELKKEYMLIRSKDYQPAIKNWWNGFSAVLDLSNPKTVGYFKGQLQFLCNNYGIDGFKFDAGDPKYYDREDISCTNADENTQCENWAKIGLEYPYNEYRACFKFGGQPLVQRLWDKFHIWDGDMGLEALIPDSLAQGIIGHVFSCADMIGGGDLNQFWGNISSLDEELVVRYAQCTSLMPMMQFSAAPWRILSKENFEIVSKAVLLHSKYAELIVKLAKNSAKTGEPIIRFMEYSFPNQGFENVIDQFMLGDDILVAPVIKKEYKRIVKIPIGTWKSDKDELFTGPASIEIDAPLDRLPYFTRENK